MGNTTSATSFTDIFRAVYSETGITSASNPSGSLRVDIFPAEVIGVSAAFSTPLGISCDDTLSISSGTTGSFAICGHGGGALPVSATDLDIDIPDTIGISCSDTIAVSATDLDVDITETIGMSCSDTLGISTSDTIAISAVGLDVDITGTIGVSATNLDIDIPDTIGISCSDTLGISCSDTIAISATDLDVDIPDTIGVSCSDTLGISCSNTLGISTSDTIAISGEVGIDPYDTLSAGMVSAVAASTAYQLAAYTCNSVAVKADDSNTSDIYVGSSTVTCSGGISDGWRLDSGQSISLRVSNLNKIYFNANAAAQKLYWIIIA